MTNATDQVYSVWHAGNDACIWGNVRLAGPIKTMDHRSRQVALSEPGIPQFFLSPLKLLNRASKRADLEQGAQRDDADM
jgi:hypothetical protein